MFLFFLDIFTVFYSRLSVCVTYTTKHNTKRCKGNYVSSVVYNPLSAYIVGYKTVHLQYIRGAVVKDTLLLLVSAICVIIMCCFLLYDVNNSAQYEYNDIAYLSEISKGGSVEGHENQTMPFLPRRFTPAETVSTSGSKLSGVTTGRRGGVRGGDSGSVGFSSRTHFPESPIF